jgi:hypothetical protein
MTMVVLLGPSGILDSSRPQSYLHARQPLAERLLQPQWWQLVQPDSEDLCLG